MRAFQRKSGASPARGRRSSPGTMTVENSSPFALWIVITCSVLGRAQIGRAVEILQVLLQAGWIGQVVRLARSRRGDRSTSPRPRDPRRPRGRPGRRAQATRPRRARAAIRAGAHARPRRGNAAHADEALASRGGQRATPCRVGEQFRHRALVAPHESQEIRERKPAPGRAQHGQPRDAVGRMAQRARERDEVLHALALAQLLDVHGARSAAPPRAAPERCGRGACGCEPGWRSSRRVVPRAAARTSSTTLRRLVLAGAVLVIRRRRDAT